MVSLSLLILTLNLLEYNQLSELHCPENAVDAKGRTHRMLAEVEQLYAVESEAANVFVPIDSPATQSSEGSEGSEGLEGSTNEEDKDEDKIASVVKYNKKKLESLSRCVKYTKKERERDSDCVKYKKKYNVEDDVAIKYPKIKGKVKDTFKKFTQKGEEEEEKYDAIFYSNKERAAQYFAVQYSKEKDLQPHDIFNFKKKQQSKFRDVFFKERDLKKKQRENIPIKKKGKELHRTDYYVLPKYAKYKTQESLGYSLKEKDGFKYPTVKRAISDYPEYTTIPEQLIDRSSKEIFNSLIKDEPKKKAEIKHYIIRDYKDKEGATYFITKENEKHKKSKNYAIRGRRAKKSRKEGEQELQLKSKQVHSIITPISAEGVETERDTDPMDWSKVDDMPIDEEPKVYEKEMKYSKKEIEKLDEFKPETYNFDEIIYDIARSFLQELDEAKGLCGRRKVKKSAKQATERLVKNYMKQKGKKK
ncbi:hypothetical protein PVMG_05677 [Plasmodium vivax Mauritania I]|uniref:Uncharacterized protein n=1 Tax=Plasmodium vivax Mauritania I TaxID=1035515 RepID=A0A0J9TK76_PLAVI|nr:hypothetical protein PVMG_05677 [Plasmodium vivax Mauritania I]